MQQLVWIGSATAASILIIVLCFIFVTWGVDFGSLTPDSRGWLLITFIPVEIVTLFAFRVYFEDRWRFF